VAVIRYGNGSRGQGLIGVVARYSAWMRVNGALEVVVAQVGVLVVS
jgi:hypothetical protein